MGRETWNRNTKKIIRLIKEKIAILGLGEAGSHFANDLVSLGYQVSGWDPDLKRSLDERVEFSESNAEAVKQASVIFNVNLSSVADEVAREIKDHVKSDAIFCAMNTSSPSDKVNIENILQGSCRVVDVAIMAPVPPKGIRTPFSISGNAANDLLKIFSELDNCKIINDKVGTAAQMKLLRSIVYKGFAAVVCEAMEAGRSYDKENFIKEQIFSIIGTNEELIERFLSGSKEHAVRRSHEMNAVCNMLEQENLSFHMSKGAYCNLSRYIDYK